MKIHPTRVPLLTFLMMGLLSTMTGATPERAETIYKQLCFNCHGVHFDGGIGPSLKDSYWRHGDSPEDILKAINKGIPGTEMIGYEAVFPEEDRLALRDLILAQHEGLRGVVRYVYPRAPFQGKRLSPELFDKIKPLSETRLPENVYYFERKGDGILRGKSKLYIKEAGQYHFSIRNIGRTSIFINGKEVHYSDEKTPKDTHINKTFDLQPGIHHLEVLHEEKTTHSYRFSGFLLHKGGKRWPLHGRSLEGNVPKVITAGTEAKVIRKWIAGLPPRTLLCLLPNKVLVAYNPVEGKILAAWHSASINQTPSLTDRSQKPSEIRGEPVPDAARDILQTDSLRLLYYEMQMDTVHLVSLSKGKEKTVMISPKGQQSFKVTIR